MLCGKIVYIVIDIQEGRGARLAPIKCTDVRRLNLILCPLIGYGVD